MVCHLLAPHKGMEGPVLHDGLAWIPHARPAPLRSWGRTTQLWCGVGPAWHAQPTARARRAAAVPGLGLSPACGGNPAHHLGSTTHHQGRETHPQSHKTLQKREPGYSTPRLCTLGTLWGTVLSLHLCPWGGSSMGTDPTHCPAVGDTGPQTAQTPSPCWRAPAPAARPLLGAAPSTGALCSQGTMCHPPYVGK